MQHYINRILGPLRDRIDLEVRVEPSWPGDEITDSAELRTMVASAIRLQNERFRGETIRFNGDIAQEDLHRLAPLVLPEAQREWREVINSGRYSYRSLAGIRRLARTIADLNAVAEIRPTDLQEALYYRCLDIYWSDYSHSGQL
jgi:magnesium chelatase family protein